MRTRERIIETEQHLANISNLPGLTSFTPKEIDRSIVPINANTSWRSLIERGQASSDEKEKIADFLNTLHAQDISLSLHLSKQAAYQSSALSDKLAHGRELLLALGQNPDITIFTFIHGWTGTNQIPPNELINQLLKVFDPGIVLLWDSIGHGASELTTDGYSLLPKTAELVKTPLRETLPGSTENMALALIAFDYLFLGGSQAKHHLIGHSFGGKIINRTHNLLSELKNHHLQGRAAEILNTISVPLNDYQSSLGQSIGLGICGAETDIPLTQGITISPVKLLLQSMQALKHPWLNKLINRVVYLEDELQMRQSNRDLQCIKNNALDDLNDNEQAKKLPQQTLALKSIALASEQFQNVAANIINHYISVLGFHGMNHIDEGTRDRVVNHLMQAMFNLEFTISTMLQWLYPHLPSENSLNRKNLMVIEARAYNDKLTPEKQHQNWFLTNAIPEFQTLAPFIEESFGKNQTGLPDLAYSLPIFFTTFPAAQLFFPGGHYSWSEPDNLTKNLQFLIQKIHFSKELEPIVQGSLSKVIGTDWDGNISGNNSDIILGLSEQDKKRLRFLIVEDHNSLVKKTFAQRLNEVLNTASYILGPVSSDTTNGMFLNGIEEKSNLRDRIMKSPCISEQKKAELDQLLQRNYMHYVHSDLDQYSRESQGQVCTTSLLRNSNQHPVVIPITLDEYRLVSSFLEQNHKASAGIGHPNTQLQNVLNNSFSQFDAHKGLLQPFTQKVPIADKAMLCFFADCIPCAIHLQHSLDNSHTLKTSALQEYINQECHVFRQQVRLYFQGFLTARQLNLKSLNSMKKKPELPMRRTIPARFIDLVIDTIVDTYFRDQLAKALL